MPCVTAIKLHANTQLTNQNCHLPAKTQVVKHCPRGWEGDIPRPWHSPEPSATPFTSLGSPWQPLSPARARLFRALSPGVRKEMGKGSAGEEPSQVTHLLLLPLSNAETRGQDPVPPQGWHSFPGLLPAVPGPHFHPYKRVEATRVCFIYFLCKCLCNLLSVLLVFTHRGAETSISPLSGNFNFTLLVWRCWDPSVLQWRRLERKDYLKEKKNRRFFWAAECLDEVWVTQGVHVAGDIAVVPGLSLVFFTQKGDKA